jgi:hypothetical protein
MREATRPRKMMNASKTYKKAGKVKGTEEGKGTSLN